MAISDYRFEKLPRPIQIAVFTGFVLCLAFVFHQYYLKNVIAEHTAIQAEIGRLELEVAQGSAIESRLQRFRKELAQLEERLTVLQAILPAEKETPAVLRSVQHMAASSNLKINRFTPQPVVPRAFYSDWPIKMQVEGTYDGLGTFFEKVSQATRIIDVDSIVISGTDKEMSPSHTLVANCTATTFVFREDQDTGSESPRSGTGKKGVKP